MRAQVRLARPHQIGLVEHHVLHDRCHELGALRVHALKKARREVRAFEGRVAQAGAGEIDISQILTIEDTASPVDLRARHIETGRFCSRDEARHTRWRDKNEK